MTSTLDGGADRAGAEPAAGGRMGIDRDLARARVRAGLFGLDEPRRRVGRHEIVGRLGRGAMGVVYAAHDPELARRVAIKLLHAAGNARLDAAHHRRLQAEAQAMARISHPNVVAVFEVGRLSEAEGGQIFVVMELVDGVTLRQWVRREQPSWQEIVAAYAQAARGLAAAHRAGVVHRDFKPDNAMIDRSGRVRVTDFGVARTSEAVSTDGAAPIAANTTDESDVSLAGTPAYMAPEQLLGGAVDGRSDQWSLCVSLWEALWGARPYAGTTASALAVQLLEADEAPSPPDSRIPARIVAAIRRGLAPDPERRFVDAEALARALVPPRSRLRTPAILAAVAVLGGATVAALSGGDVCPRDREAFAAAWSDADAEEVTQAFTATGIGHAPQTAARIVESLDAYRQMWLEQRHDACVATRVDARQDDARLDLRIRCLDRRRDQTAALVAQLRRPDAQTLEHAREAVDAMIAPARCDDDAFLDDVGEPPADPELAAAIGAIEADLDRAEVSAELGDPSDALARVELALAAAEPLGHAPLIADIQARRAALLGAVGAFDDARAALEDAFFAAQREGLHDRAAAVALELSANHAARAEIDRATHWLRAARTEHAAPAGPADDFEFEYLDVARYVADGAGEYPRALELAEQAVAQLDRADQVRRAGHSGTVYANLAHQLSQIGRVDEAVPAAARAVETEVAYYGADHPYVAIAHGEYADALSNVGRFAEALDQCRRAVAIREAMGEPESVHLATATLRYGIVLQRAGRSAEALEYLARATAMLARHDADVPRWNARYTTAMAHEDLGHPDLALAEYERLAADIAASYGDDHPILAAVFSNAGKIEFSLGRLARARALFERALEIRDRFGATGDTERIGTLVGLARVLAAEGEDERALALLREGAALSRGSALTEQGIYAELRLAEFVARTDADEAAQIVTNLRRRCDAREVTSGLTAPCEMAATWPLHAR